MRADVAQAARRAALLRVRAPRRLLLAGALEIRSQPALRVFDDHLADIAQHAPADQLARLLDHRIAGVIVREDEDFLRLLDDLPQLERLLEIERDRLVEDHIEPRLEEQLGGGKVPVVRSDNDHEIQAPIPAQLCLGCGHFLVAAVGALGRDEEVGRRRLGAFRIGRERAGDQFRLAVHPRRDAVHRADERPPAPADHPKTKLPRDHRLASSSCRANAASNATPLVAKSRRRTKAAASAAPCTRSIRMSSHSTDSGPR